MTDSSSKFQRFSLKKLPNGWRGTALKGPSSLCPFVFAFGVVWKVHLYKWLRGNIDITTRWLFEFFFSFLVSAAAAEEVVAQDMVIEKRDLCWIELWRISSEADHHRLMDETDLRKSNIYSFLRGVIHHSLFVVRGNKWKERQQWFTFFVTTNPRHSYNEKHESFAAFCRYYPRRKLRFLEQCLCRCRQH